MILRTILLVATSVATFVLAAKAHGRELRLERIVAGVDVVRFGGVNPPFVEALWAAERLRFWTAAPLLGLLVGVALARLGASRTIVAAASVVWAPTVVFVALGLASFWRAGGIDRAGALASVGWWSLVLVSAGLVAWVARGS
ncbi:MAG: hypothetical protein R3A51_13975 [Nannocystaceae bacterium]